MTATLEAHLLPLVEAFGISPDDVEIEPLNFAENATYRVRDRRRRGPGYALRVYRPGRHSTERIHSELSWVDALAGEGIPTLTPHRTTEGGLTAAVDLPDGSTTRAALVDFLGTDAHQPDEPQTLAELGALAAMLQRHARSWTPPAGFDRPAWDIESTLTERTAWGQWVVADLPDRAGEVLHEARAKVLADLPAFGPGRVVLQHADLKPGNSIWSGGVLHVIDFDDCGYGLPLFDLAASLTGMENRPDVAEPVRVWLSGYARHLTPGDEDLATIPALLMQRRLMILGWLLAHRQEHPSVDREAVLADSVHMARRYLDDALVEPQHI